MANETFDLVVIGAGPGGYVAAIRAAQLGLKVAMVEKRATFGGTCLNVGCIPSKALLQSSHLFEEAGHDLAEHGIVLAPPRLDFAQLMKRKGEVVDATTKGVAFLFRKNKIASFQGTGRIDKAGAVSVLGDDGAVKDTLATKNILIASGSEVTPLPGVTSEPEAMRMFLVASASFTAPSSPNTDTAPALSMRPVPWNEVILFLRNRKATPLVVASTTSPLRFMSLSLIHI